MFKTIHIQPGELDIKNISNRKLDEYKHHFDSGRNEWQQKYDSTACHFHNSKNVRIFIKIFY
jgi:hypothetical protein